eukprot:CAMPEP_0185781304 /NCGR_PEP_ID=MMETSP1174-20130828/101860_1 /TAXON_ID=35687 /ORGANISM="Dictyocha speculum, Strain CCMP1381" /LENGTH=115 /DNA_ID=CAMNT_0028471225 /DNA_START=140 /DNA_END=487 /DNA_ORIENTATION=+
MSESTLKKLDDLEESFSGFIQELDLIEEMKDAASYEELAEAKNRLAQLNGLLEKFQFTEVDAVDTANLHSGKSQARAQRKGLNSEVDGLRERIIDLQQSITSAMKTLGDNAAGRG